MTSPLVTVSQRNPDTQRPHAQDMWTQSTEFTGRSSLPAGSYLSCGFCEFSLHQGFKFNRFLGVFKVLIYFYLESSIFLRTKYRGLP